MSLNDLRYSARSLLKNPAFAILATLTIALAVGANTAIFTAVEGVLLKSFSFPEAERLVVVDGVTKSQPNMSVSFPDYLDWRAEQQVFIDLAARASAGRGAAYVGRLLERSLGWRHAAHQHDTPERRLHSPQRRDDQ